MSNSNLPDNYDRWRTASDPDYPQMRYRFLCEDCDDPVYIGQKYYEVDGFKYCRTCISNYRHSTDKDEICEVCGETIPYDELAYNIHGRWICVNCMDYECAATDE